MEIFYVKDLSFRKQGENFLESHVVAAILLSQTQLKKKGETRAFLRAGSVKLYLQCKYHVSLRALGSHSLHGNLPRRVSRLDIPTRRLVCHDKHTADSPFPRRVVLRRWWTVDHSPREDEERQLTFPTKRKNAGNRAISHAITMEGLSARATVVQVTRLVYT